MRALVIGASGQVGGAGGLSLVAPASVPMFCEPHVTRTAPLH